MANNTQLKNSVSDVIKTNGTQSITGQVLQNTLITIINSLGGNYQFVGIANISTNPGTPDQNVFYLAGEGVYVNFSNLEIEVGQIGVLKWNGSWSKQILEIGSGGGNLILNWDVDVSTTKKQVLPKYRKPGVQISYNEPNKGWINQQYIGTAINDTNWVKDENWKLIITQTEYTELSNIVNAVNLQLDLLNNKISDITKEVITENDEEIVVQNDSNEEIAKINNDGIFSKDFFDKNNNSLTKTKLNNCWGGKTWAEYGDSFTQMFCNGDFSFPYEIQYNTGWGILVANALNISQYKGRGISGSSIQWANNRQKIGLVDTLTGVLLSTQNSTYEDFNNVPEGQTKIRDIGCSWSRITGMFPEEIKDNIDVVTVFLHNDYIKISDESEWIPDNKTDPEWGTSSYYSNYGGDYNIETWRGSILSLIMKFQAWMPNAKLILCTPASGSISYGEENKIYPDRAYDGSQFEKSEIMRDLAKRLSIPLIDVNANCGINMLNRTLYLQDYIHPNNTIGQKMIAEPFIGGFNRIFKL